MRCICQTLLIALTLTGVVFSGAVSALSVGSVTLTGNVINVEKNERARLQFSIDAAATIAIEWYDARDYRVARQALGQLGAGEHDATWYGVDDVGKPLPAEAYTYVIKAVADGKTVRYDMTDLSAGDAIPDFAARWQPDNKTIEYAMRAPGRVRLRVGLDNNGPLMMTVVDWAPRAAGVYRELWDGMDISRVVDIGKHPKLVVVAEAFALPSNAVLISHSKTPGRFVALDKPSQRSRQDTAYRKKMFDFSRQVAQQLGDFPLELRIAGAKNVKGVPVVSGPVRIVVDVNDEHLNRISGTRYEPVLFLDGQFLFENEVGYLPMTYNWDARAVNAGEHYITANVRGYEGNFGIATLKLIVRHDDRKESQ